MTAIDPIGELQDALIDRLAAAFRVVGGQSLVRRVLPLEVPFDAQTSSEFRIVPPAVHVTPLIVQPTDVGGQWTTRWGVYVISDRATPPTRTRGAADPFGIGSHAMMVRAAAALEHWLPPVAEASTVRLEGIENLTGLVFVRQKLSVWSVALACEIHVALENPVGDLPADQIADFLTFHADFDIAPFEDAPDTLPAARDAALTEELPGP